MLIFILILLVLAGWAKRQPTNYQAQELRNDIIRIDNQLTIEHNERMIAEYNR